MVFLLYNDFSSKFNKKNLDYYHTPTYYYQVQHTEEFGIEEYIEHSIQKHYKKWADQMEYILRHNIDTNQFKFKLGEVEEVEFEIEE